MKKYLLGILIIIIGFAQLFPVSPIKLDIKTRYKDKFELKGVKWGVKYFLEQDGYNVVELGEDYAVWLKDIEEQRVESDQYTIKLIVSITPPSLFREKKPEASDTMEVKYKFNPKEVNVDDTGFTRFIKEKIENIKKKEKIRAYFVGKAVAEKVKELLKSLAEKK